ncbi:ribosome maturation factor RimM [Stappia sp. ES.058]|uniref:ribosome maturation factor RimM n=1 Tax=Stappia sp. ES.058 TaxID=1881061 RepID=UPI00087A97B3|nr:ribosome maturation factor RimM [Stappia sp. ES.058]SDU40542.1 16S rRNA processing protein RimM [Stappia sp. ES.058]
MAQDRILMARIGAAHGIRGEVRVKPFGDDPLSFTDYGPLETADGKRRLTVYAARVQKNMVITRFEGIDDRNAAEALNGLDLYISRSALPDLEEDDDFYHADLLGLRARTAEGEDLGKIVAVPDFGAGALLEIRPDIGTSFFVPFTRDAVPEVDLTDGKVTVVLPPDYEDDDEERDDDA